MTIKEIENQMKATNEAREQMKHTKLDNENLARKYREDADAAAIAGDIARYKELKALADDAEAVAYVCGKQLEVEQKPPVTVDQTIEAWNEYVSDYNRKLAAKLRKFEAAKATMLKEYADAVVLQGEACEMRERLARYAGRELGPSGFTDFRLSATYPMDYIPCAVPTSNGVKLSIIGSNMLDPDAVYYLSSLNLVGHDLTVDPRQNAISRIVGAHRANS